MSRTWQEAWREGFAPQLSTRALIALLEALVSDDARLIQGATTTPIATRAAQHQPVEAACALGFCGWQGEGLETAGEVERYFALLCVEADSRVDLAAFGGFVNWFDETPRDEMRRLLLAEVEATIEAREEVLLHAT